MQCPRWLILSFLTVISVVVCPCRGAEVLEVPSQYATITAAIAAAEEGDTVRVAPGTYVENIDFAGKAIIVTSHYVPGGDWTLVENTVIDGSDPADPAAASTVIFQSEEGRESILQGFTISGGQGTEWVDPQFPTYTWRGGGGIFCFQSSPTIRYSQITGNVVANNGDVDGVQAGGILCFGGNPLVHNTIIRANQAESGGGLVVDYSGATVRNTIISNNICGQSYGGGGIWTIGSFSEPIVIENCAVVDNISPTHGGAIYAWESTITIRNSIIRGNRQAYGATIHTVRGGQVAISYSDVEGGVDGDGNIDIDPDFSSPGIYLLDFGSPCTDAGDPDPSFNDPADDDAPGQAEWPALGGVRNDMGAFGGPGALFIGTNTATTLYFVAAAAAAEGAEGSYFVTDLEINNSGAEAMNYSFWWLPRGTDNASPTESAWFSLSPGASVRYSNVLQTIFAAENAIGALAISADSDAALIMSRTYNLAADGTFGQAMPGISATDLTPADERVRVLFMTEDPDFRSNLGILNGVDQPITVQWELYAADGSSLGTDSAQLPAWGNDQINGLFASHAPIAAAYVDVWTTTSGGAFTCYGSVLDNATNDPTTILPPRGPSR